MSEENKEVENVEVEAPEVETEKVETNETTEANENSETEKDEEGNEVDEVSKWKGHSRSWETKAKESAEKLKKAEEEAAELKQSLADFTSRLEQLETEKLETTKAAALTSAGLSAELASLITGKDNESITAQVELLKSNLQGGTTTKGVAFVPTQKSTQKQGLGALINAELSEKS